MMRNVNPLGLIVCGVCVAVSLAFAVLYGMALSPDPLVALIYSAIGVAAVLWEVVGWHRVAHLYRIERPWAARVGVIGLVLATVVTVQYELGFLATLFEAKASIGESSASARAAMEAERANLQAQITRAGIVRPVEAVRGELFGMRALQSQADRAKADGDAEAADKGCGERCRAHRSVYTALSAKLAASPVDKLQAELGIAEGVERAQERIRKITADLAPLASAGVADARANYMHQMFGLSETGARLTLSLLIILFLLAGRSWSPFTFMDPPSPAAAVIDMGAVRHAEPALDRRPAAELFPPADAIDASAPAPDADFIESDMGLEAAEEAEEPPFDLEDLEMLRAFDSGHHEAAVDASGPIEDEAEPEPLTPAQERVRAVVRRFIVDCCLVHGEDHSQREPAATMQNAFRQWQADNEIVEIVNSNDFGAALEAILSDLGGGKIHSNGKKYVGIRLKPYVTHRLSLAGEPKVVDTRDGPALGSNGRDRRAAIAAGSLDGIPHGNA
jgi:hypothetical protein